jgi:hypothetical protein
LTRRRLVWGLLALLCWSGPAIAGSSAAAVIAAPQQPATPSPTAGLPSLHHPPSLAYYYIWYTHASWGRAKSDYPSLGRYSSDDRKVMQLHVAMAQHAGLDGFLVSWKASKSLDSRLATLVSVARAAHFRLGIIYEGLNFQRNPLPIVTVRSDLVSFADRYATDPVFRVFDRPTVVWSGTWKYSPADVASVRAALGNRVRLLASEKSVSGYQRLADMVDGNAYYWSSVNPQTSPDYVNKLRAMGEAVHSHHGLWIAPAAPGFDARLVGGKKVVDRQGGATLRREWGAALASSPDAIGLISWNEFSENSYVEPSVKYGDQMLRVVRDISVAPPVQLEQLSTGDSSAGGTGTIVRFAAAGGGLAVVLLGGVAAVRLRERRRRRPTNPPDS